MREPEPPLDPRLERFQEALAEASFGGERAGSLSIKADVFFTISGPWWRRRWIDPRWGFEWLFFHDPTSVGDLRQPGSDFDDGAVLDTAGFDELLTDSFELRGKTYSLRWVTRLEAPELWMEHFGDPA